MIDLSRLQSNLLNTGLQNKDNPLFQVLTQLIKALQSINKDLASITTNTSNTQVITNIFQTIGSISESDSSGDDGLVIPGPRGLDGISNVPGPTGPMGAIIFADAGEDGDIFPPIQGNQGNPGTTGSQGPIGPSIVPGDEIYEENIFQQFVSSSGSASGLVLLEEHTASASSSLTFTTWYSSLYDDYLIEIVNVVNGSSAIPRIRYSTDGGANYISGANYDWGWQFNYTGGNGSIFGGGATSIQWRDTNTTLNANGSWNGRLTLSNPAGSLYKSLVGQITVLDNIAGLIFFHGGGEFNTGTAVNAFQVDMSAGTFNGTIRVYGLSK